MYRPIKNSLIQVGRVVIGKLCLIVRDNFISHEERLDEIVAAPNGIPTGMTIMYGGSSAPSGFLLCDGSVVAQASYPDLFAILGSSFNTGGEGGGNFRLPDSRGRMIIGAGHGSGLTDRTVGESGGTETHLLTTAELPIHTHAKTDPGHTHTTPTYTTGTGTTHLSTHTGSSGGNTNVESKVTGLSFANTGGGGAHENMQPSIAINFIIKT